MEGGRKGGMGVEGREKGKEGGLPLEGWGREAVREGGKEG